MRSDASKCGYMRSYEGIKIPRGPEGSYKVQASGFRGHVPIIDIFTDLFFYFLKKKKCWNIGTLQLSSLEVLVIANSRRFLCSRGVGT
jgi:hypothetical protein